MNNRRETKPETFFLWHVLEGIKWPHSLRSLHYRNYRLFFFGQLISLIGTWIQTIAQNWLVYRLSGSELQLGLLNFVALIPLIPISLWSGDLSDRMSKRRLLVIVQTLMMFQAIALAALTYFNIVQVWHVMFLAFIFGGLQAFDMPARQSFIPELVQKDYLSNAIALNSVVFNSARIIGPSIAGILIALTGEASAFFLNGLSYLAVIAALLLMRIEPVKVTADGQSLAGRLKEGIRYTLRHRTAWIMITLVGVSSLFTIPFMTMLPAIVKYFPGKGAADYGLMMSIVGLGALGGAMWVATLKSDGNFRKYLAIGNLGFPIFMIFFSFSREYILSTTLLFIVGGCFETQNALANTILQNETPEGLRGRVMSLYSLVYMGSFRLGSLQAGSVAEATSPFFALGAGAVLSLLYNIFIVTKYLFKKAD